MRRTASSLFVLAIGVALIYIATGGLQSQTANGKVVSQTIIQPQAQITAHRHDHYVVTGSPSISEQLVHNVLCSSSKTDTPHVSPACGSEHDLYTLGQQYEIDPVYALAFFLKESTLGRYGVAKETRSLGNIRCIPGYTCIDGFRAYPSYRASYEDWYQLIRFYVNAWRLPTVATIVERYAPRSENDTDGYIAFIEHCVDMWRAVAETGGTRHA